MICQHAAIVWMYNNLYRNLNKQITGQVVESYSSSITQLLLSSHSGLRILSLSLKRYSWAQEEGKIREVQQICFLDQGNAFLEIKKNERIDGNVCLIIDSLLVAEYTEYMKTGPI